MNEFNLFERFLFNQIENKSHRHSAFYQLRLIQCLYAIVHTNSEYENFHRKMENLQQSNQIQTKRKQKWRSLGSFSSFVHLMNVFHNFHSSWIFSQFSFQSWSIGRIIFQLSIFRAQSNLLMIREKLMKSLCLQHYFLLFRLASLLFIQIETCRINLSVICILDSKIVGFIFTVTWSDQSCTFHFLKIS